MPAAALNRLQQQISEAFNAKTVLALVGGGSKAFYGETAVGTPLDLTPLSGVLQYQPSELVITVAAGTPLSEVETLLAQHGQYLPFEPPRLTGSETMGGVVSAGLAGPARATSGGVRDYLLGASLLDGRGRHLTFGGQVIKNVAGYDVSRLMAGALGTLGVLTELSLKVCPQPAATDYLGLDCNDLQALHHMHQCARQPLPLNAAAWHGERLHLRLAGASAAVAAAKRQLASHYGFADDSAGESWWHDLRDQRLPFFNERQGQNLYRIALPSTLAPLNLNGETLVEWGGSQRWLWSTDDAATLRQTLAAFGAKVTHYRGHDRRQGVFPPPSSVHAAIAARLKSAFDPLAILNRGRMYPV